MKWGHRQRWMSRVRPGRRKGKLQEQRLSGRDESWSPAGCQRPAGWQCWPLSCFPIFVVPPVWDGRTGCPGLLLESAESVTKVLPRRKEAWSWSWGSWSADSDTTAPTGRRGRPSPAPASALGTRPQLPIIPCRKGWRNSSPPHTTQASGFRRFS